MRERTYGSHWYRLRRRRWRRWRLFGPSVGLSCLRRRLWRGGRRRGGLWL